MKAFQFPLWNKKKYNFFVDWWCLRDFDLVILFESLLTTNFIFPSFFCYMKKINIFSSIPSMDKFLVHILVMLPNGCQFSFGGKSMLFQICPGYLKYSKILETKDMERINWWKFDLSTLACPWMSRSAKSLDSCSRRSILWRKRRFSVRSRWKKVSSKHFNWH